MGGMAAAALLVVGCGESTGVLIEVSRGEGVPANLGRLEFHIGVDGIIPGDPSSYVDPEPEEDVRLNGRDIAADPYRLLIRPREHAGARIMVAVLGYSGGEVVGFGALERPVGFVEGEVAMWPILLEAELPGGFGATDTGCISWVTESGDQVSIGGPSDKDCDGWTDEDCDDLDPTINPDANETCGNAVDEDCDQQTDEDVDEDGDQVTTCGGDCDDRDDSVSPLAEELCDGIDNDCNAACDETHDADGDLYTPCGSKIIEEGRDCLLDPARFDCNDEDYDIKPGAEELCDGEDNDCDQVCDDSDAGLDRDGDGFTSCGSITDHCGVSDLNIDCQDRNAAIHPGAAELCNGFDDDCDGERLQRGPCFATSADPAGCFFGERDCAEEQGEAGDWEGACQPRNGQLDEVPAEVCAAYETCDAEPESRPDPYTCSLEGSGLALATCALHYRIADAEPCPGAETELPAGDLTDCLWSIVGTEPVQGDYQIGLRPVELPDETPQPTLALCDAVLVVAAAAAPPGPHIVLLARTDQVLGETTYFAVSLSPTAVDDCEDAGSALACQEFPLP